MGGESSGHLVWLGTTTTGDGIISALQVLSAMQKTNKTLHELKKQMQKCPQVMINVRSAKKIKIEQSLVLTQAIKQAETELGRHGRVLLRSSGTEPVIRVMVEGEDEKQVKNIAKNLANIVEQEIKI